MFYFSLSYFDLFGDILNKFPQVESVLPTTVTGECNCLCLDSGTF